MVSDVTNVTNVTMFPGTGGNSNNTTYTPTLQELNEAEVRRLIPTLVYLAVLSVTGIIGNSFVCHVYRTRYRLSNSQCFILCLSAIDLFSCTVVIPLEVATVVNQYAFEHLWLCKLSRFFNTLGTLSASFLLLFIAIDRYRKVCRPFGWQIKANVAKFLCVLSVLLGLLFSWPAIFIYGKQMFKIANYELTGTECSTDDSMLNTIFPLMNAALFGGLFIVGIICICILYCLIGREVHKHAKKMPKELSVRNRSIPMLSSTMDGRDSRISGEIDTNILSKYDPTAVKRESKKESTRKKKSFTRKSAKFDSESSWTEDKKDFDLSCSMDCTKDANVFMSESSQDNDGDTQSEDSGIKSDQTTKEDNSDGSNARCFRTGEASPETSSDATRNGQCSDDDDDDEIKVNNVVEMRGGSRPDSQRSTSYLEPVKEHDDDIDIVSTDDVNAESDKADTASVEDSEVEDDADTERVENRETETSKNNYRKFSALSYTSDIEIKPKSLRSRLSSIGSRISTAVIRRMTSLVSTTSVQSVTVVKAQYLKQARARKTAFLMFLISLAFVLSYMPHLLLMIIRTVKSSFVESLSEDEGAVYKFFLRSYFLNCAINPVIYGVCDTRFRTACKEIFSNCCGRSKSRDMN